MIEAPKSDTDRLIETIRSEGGAICAALWCIFAGLMILAYFVSGGHV